MTEDRPELLAAEAHFEALKRQAAPPAGLNDLQLRRIWRNLQTEPRPRRAWLRWATVAGVLLLSSGAFAARATLTSAVRRLLAPSSATTTATSSATPSSPTPSSPTTSAAAPTTSPAPTPAGAPTPGGASRGAATTKRATDLARPLASAPPADLREARASSAAEKALLDAALVDAGGDPAIDGFATDPPPAAGTRPPAPATRPRPGRAPGSLALVTPGPGPSLLAREAALTGEAVRLLRRERDPAAALAALSAYRSGFPYGQLHREADRLTVEALLALDRRAEALGFLQRLDLGSSDDLPLRLLRGELAAPAGCAEAVADFTAVIAEQAPALLERALRGRARCRAHLGDPTGSARDLATCRRWFPRGPCAGGTP
jgi:hypothetical protein